MTDKVAYKAGRYPKKAEVPGYTFGIVGGAIFVSWTFVLVIFNPEVFIAQLAVGFAIIALSVIVNLRYSKLRRMFGFVLLFLGILAYAPLAVWFTTNMLYSIPYSYYMAIVSSFLDESPLGIGTILIFIGAARGIIWGLKTK